MPYENVRRWIGILKKEREGKSPASGELEFVEVPLAAGGARNGSDSGISLHAAGFEIQVTCDFDQATLLNVLTVLRTLAYCPTPISMRKSFDGLAGAVEEYIQQEPESGHAFVFFGRSRKMVKILQWQGDGFTIWMKRLESGAFHLPKSAEGRIELSSRELAALLSGIKPHRYYKRYSKKS